MARGRMIVKEITYDRRVWSLSATAWGLLPYCFPHLETDGTLPRAASSIKGMCFCLAKITTGQIEKAINEWLHTKPPICKDGGDGRLFFVDFETTNSGLDFYRMRKYRDKIREQNQNGGSAKRPLRRPVTVRNCP